VSGPLDVDRDLGWAEAMYDGERTGQRLGSAVAGPGDVDGDGLDDVLLGATGDEQVPSRGDVFLLFGPARQSLDDADVHISGVAAGSAYGAALAGGDLDRDGYAEWIVGAPEERPAGRIRVYAGGEIPADVEDAAAKIEGGRDGQATGQSLSVFGDANGDTFLDLAVGMPFHDPDAAAMAGSGLVFYGPLSGERVATDADGKLAGDNASMGTRVAPAGDLDLNGLSDLVITRPAGLSSGELYDYLYVVSAVGW
jgi:hypothetical protein